jgi:hypothetical protein
MSSTASTTISQDWRPRLHQLSLFGQFGHGRRYRRGCAVWHRRAGKDSCALNFTTRDMFRRVGTYWHLFPEQTQTRRAVWNGIDSKGRIIDQVLPPQVRARTSGQEMLIETLNGSIWQMAGSDNFDSLVGSNPVGAREAQCAEQVLSCRYGIPRTHWEVDGWIKAPERQRSPELITAIYASLNLSALAARATLLLRDHRLERDHPLITGGERLNFSRRGTRLVRACNVFAEIMQIPTDLSPSISSGDG